MGRVLKAVYAEIKGLHQSAYILAAFAFGSQLLALVRDRLFAHTFGTGTELDIYYAAFKIPDVLFVLFASILSIYVLIPFVSERTNEGRYADAQKLLSSTLSAFLILYLAGALVIFIAAPRIAPLLFPGFDSVSHEQMVFLMRLLLVQPFLLGISSLFGVVTQIGQRFIVYALGPLLYNGGIILGTLVLYPVLGMAGIVWGVIVGALLHALVHIPYLYRSPLLPCFTFSIDFRVVRDVLLQSLPRAVTLSMGQIVLLACVGIASIMAEGSVSVFQFAFNLQSVPLAIVGVSYSVAAFPLLAHLYANGEKLAFVARVESALRHIIFWIIPITALLIVIRAQFVRVILGTGAFDWNDTRLTAAVFALLLVSLVAQAIMLLIVRAFYAGGNTRTPLFTTVIFSVSTLLLALGLYALHLSHAPFREVLEYLLRVRGVPGTEVLTLPLAYSIGSLMHMSMLLFLFARQFLLPFGVVRGVFVRACLSSLLGSLVAYGALQGVVHAVRTETVLGVFLHGFIAGVCGIVTVVIALRFLRSPELSELWSTLRKTSVVSRVLGPEKVDSLAL